MAVFLCPLVAGRLSIIPDLSIRLVVLAAGVLWLIRGLRDGSLEMPSIPLVWLSIAWLGLGLLSLMRTVSLHASLLEVAALASYLLVFLMIGSLRADRTAMHGIVAALIASGVIVGTIGLREYLLAPSSGWRVFSTFFNPDFLAGFTALILPVALAWCLSRTSLVVSLAAGLAVVLAFSNLLISGSRFGMVAAVGGIAVFGALALASGSLKRAHVARLLLLAVPCVLAFAWAGKPLTSRVASIKAESHSGGFRIYTWKGTLRMARAHPVFGTGPGTFAIAYPKYAIVGWTKLAHNSYLQLAAEGGFGMPVLLLLLLGGSAIPSAVSLLRRQHEETPERADSIAGKALWAPDRSLLLSGLLGGAAASVARNLVDSDWYVAAIGTSFWTVLGAAVALGHLGRQGSISLTRRRFSAAASALGIVILYLLLVIAGQACSGQGMSLMMQGDLDGAVSWFRASVVCDPLDADHRRTLAQTYNRLGEETGELSYLRQAEGCLLRAAAMEPRYGKNWYQLGKLYAFGFHNNERAVRAFREALTCEPQSMQTLLVLAQTYETMGSEGDALAVYRRMVRIEASPCERIRAVPELVEPAYAFAHEALGREMERRGETAAAVKEYDLALDRIQRYQNSMAALGPVLESVGRRDFALEDEVEVPQRPDQGAPPGTQ